ncbi:MAG: amidohydrolase family protein [Clostridia bacterium]|nr:amidohydrolase family protein [Clostridia bacterium]
MILDSHIHIGAIMKFDMSEEIVIRSMDRYNIGVAIVSNVEGVEFDSDLNELPPHFQKSQESINTRVLNFVKQHPAKLKGLYWIKPHLEGYSSKIEEFMVNNKEHFVGFKFHQYHSKMRFTDEKLVPYLNLARKLNVPFALHTASEEISLCEHVYSIATAYPDVNFIMVHMGLGTDNEGAIKLIKQLPNLYGDTTWVSIDSVLKAVRECGSEKILFGTDSPIDGVDTYEKYLDMISAIRTKLSEKDADNVLYRNAMRIFNLPSVDRY